jgi:hypothetical protein
LKEVGQQYPGVIRTPGKKQGNGNPRQERRLPIVACPPWVG